MVQAGKSVRESRVPPGADKRILLVGLVTLLADQVTKLIVVRTLRYGEEFVVLDGFFRFVHWGNTGAAWSLFRGNNYALSIVAIVAVSVLFMLRRHFGAEARLGQFALGLMFGGILGNIIDRLYHKHVVDFLYFYVYRRSGAEVGFPAFNIADTAICVGVGLLFVLSWQLDAAGSVVQSTPAVSVDQDSSPE